MMGIRIILMGVTISAKQLQLVVEVDILLVVRPSLRLLPILATTVVDLLLAQHTSHQIILPQGLVSSPEVMNISILRRAL
jgi:hypothetical protein